MNAIHTLVEVNTDHKAACLHKLLLILLILRQSAMRRSCILLELNCVIKGLSVIT